MRLECWQTILCSHAYSRCINIIILISMIVFCSPEELLVDEVLKTLVVSPNDPNSKKFKVRAACIIIFSF